MDTELQSLLKDMALDQFAQSKLGQRLNRAVEIMETVQRHFYALYEKQDELEMTGVKAATMITFAILQKMAQGKKPADLDAEDWKDIASVVSEYAVLADDQSYTVFIFGMYEKYIRFSVDRISGAVPETVVSAITDLADQLQQKTADLGNGVISEVTYTEDCMWISLEAMIKLIASTAALFRDERITEFAQAVASFAFEYGRLKLYSRELELVNQFLESQQQLDAELEAKYATFMEDLQKESQQFYVLIDNAFTPNFREAFLHSVTLARAAGVKEDEILTTEETIDSFFLD